MLLQNVGDGAAAYPVTEVGHGTQNPAISPISIFLSHANNHILDFIGDAWPTGPRLALPSYFSAISLRCQASNMSGVTRSAISFSTRRPTSLAFAARRRR
jgi:hypothetical protein